MLPRFFPKRKVRVTGLGHRFLDTLGKKRFNFPLPFRRGSQLKEAIAKMLKEGADLRLQMIETMTGDILEAARTIAETFKAGRKILLFGNGGSAADAQHIAAEFMNRFLIERPPLPAIALTTDTSILTSISNDYAFDEVFSKQIKALGKKGDIAFGISTSGSSLNVLKAFRVAKKQGMVTIALVGEGGKAASLADIALCVPAKSTPRIQEAHVAVGHILCDLTDTLLFREAGKR
jgi:D-sedoheptulose 7-phosphate isomerase